MSIAVIKLSALMVLFLPLLIINLRTSMIKNGPVIALFFGGVLFAVFGSDFSIGSLKLVDIIGWVLMIGLLLFLFARGVIPGGPAKLFMALLPWFPFGDYLVVFTLSMIFIAVLVHAPRQNAPEKDVLIVPPMMFASCVVCLFPIMGIDV